MAWRLCAGWNAAMDGDSNYTLEDWVEGASECFLASNPALAADWDRPEEDAAWAHLAENAPLP
jgi:hypothetical protein